MCMYVYSIYVCICSETGEIPALKPYEKQSYWNRSSWQGFMPLFLTLKCLFSFMKSYGDCEGFLSVAMVSYTTTLANRHASPTPTVHELVPRFDTILVQTIVFHLWQLQFSFQASGFMNPKIRIKLCCHSRCQSCLLWLWGWCEIKAPRTMTSHRWRWCECTSSDVQYVMSRNALPHIQQWASGLGQSLIPKIPHRMWRQFHIANTCSVCVWAIWNLQVVPVVKCL